MIYYITKKLFQENNNYKLIDLQTCFELIKEKKELCIDIETTSKKIKHNTIYQGGLCPYLSDIIMLQIGDGLNQFVIDVRDFNKTELSPFIKFFSNNKDVLFIIHNAKFECKFLKKHWDIDLINIWDTMLAERILYNGLNYSNSLKALIERYFGIKQKEDSLFEEDNHFEEEDEIYLEQFLGIFDIKNKKIDKGLRNDFVNWSYKKPFTIEQILYGADDVLFPFRIKQIQEKGRTLSDGFYYNPNKAIKFQSALTRILANMELRGVKVDVVGWLSLAESNKKIRVQRLLKLKNWILKYYPAFTRFDLFDPNGICLIDWDSPKSVISFTKKIGICPKGFSKQTKKIEDTVGAKEVYVLLSNKNKEKFIRQEEVDIQSKTDFDNFWLSFLLYKKSSQLVNSFGETWISDNIHPITKKVHTNYIQLMNTGRMSSVNPNLQQLPNSKNYRKLFITDKDKDFYACDFSTQEFRCFASVSKNLDLISFFNSGETDIHSEVGTKVFRIIENNPDLIITKAEKEKRNKAKTIGFKILFG